MGLGFRVAFLKGWGGGLRKCFDFYAALAYCFWEQPEALKLTTVTRLKPKLISEMREAHTQTCPQNSQVSFAR